MRVSGDRMLRFIQGLVLAALVLCPRAAAAQTAPTAPPAIEDYGKLPALSHATLSPSGERYAAIVGLDGKRRLVVATPENKVLHRFEIGAAKVRALQWAGED